MGFQNAINSALGSVAVAGRMIENQKEQDITAGLRAKEALPELDKEVIESNKEISDATEKLEAAKAAQKEATEFAEAIHKDPNYSKEDKSEAVGMAFRAMTDRQAADRALMQLYQKREAKIKQAERYAKQIKKAKSWGGAL